MLKVGITGGIGSGKTTVCHVFELLNVPVFYADQVAKDIMITDTVLIEGITATFGQNSYLPNNILNNKHIAAIVFNNASELSKLNALVHPAVFRAFDNWVAALPPNVPYVLKEAALLFESDSYKMCDKSILVIAPEELKMQRVTQRDGVTIEQVRARMDKQFTDEEKLKRADFTIINDEQHGIIDQVLKLHQKLVAF